MNIATSYHQGMVGLTPPAKSPPKLEKVGFTEPRDVWRGVRAKDADLAEAQAPGTPSQPEKATNTTTKLAEKTVPSNLDVIFQEDSGPRSYFESFRAPGDLSRCPADFLATWGSRIGVRPAEFFDRLLDTDKVGLASGDVSLEGRAHEMDWLEYDLTLADPVSKEEVGSMCREISFDQESRPHVHHGYFQLSSGRQGQDLGKELLAKSVEVYDQIGVGSVSLYAGLDVGGYAWAKYGFKPESEQAAKRLFDTVRGRLDELDVPNGVRRSVERLLSDNRPEAIWALSDLNGVTVEEYDGPTTLGKALLLGTSWPGTLDLTCPDSRARFDQYINRGGQSGSSKGA
jgi:GNAT superfamily N-acetyltransferase